MTVRRKQLAIATEKQWFLTSERNKSNKET